MGIDIDELRRKVNSTDIVDHIDLHANIKPFLSEMLDRLEAAEKESDEFKRAPSAPSEEAAAEMGANGGHVVEAERLAFEAWMRGHNWSLCATWSGNGYLGKREQGGAVCPHAMRTRMMWAAWRDRAALAAEAK